MCNEPVPCRLARPQPNALGARMVSPDAQRTSDTALTTNQGPRRSPAAGVSKTKRRVKKVTLLRANRIELDVSALLARGTSEARGARS
jgi:hypothetical protein